MNELSLENILLNQKIENKSQAIDLVGNILLKAGSIKSEYIESMHKRDELVSVYIGNKIAIPHGIDQSQVFINKTDISIAILSEEVLFDGNPVQVVIGIAALDDEHLDIIQKIAITCSSIDNVERLLKAKTREEVIDIFREVD